MTFLQLNYQLFEQNLSTGPFAAKQRWVLANGGKKCGNGSGRVAFDIGNNLILKVSKNTKGDNQTLFEANLFQKHPNISILARQETDLSDIHGGKWLVMEKCRRTTMCKVNKLLGNENYQLRNVLKYFAGVLYKHEREKITTEQIERVKNHKLASQLVWLVKNANLCPGDLISLPSWGISTTSNELKLIDYGLNFEIARSFYGWITAPRAS